jgi:hypothetical protein
MRTQRAFGVVGSGQVGSGPRSSIHGAHRLLHATTSNLRRGPLNADVRIMSPCEMGISVVTSRENAGSPVENNGSCGTK